MCVASRKCSVAGCADFPCPGQLLNDVGEAPIGDLLIASFDAQLERVVVVRRVRSRV